MRPAGFLVLLLLVSCGDPGGTEPVEEIRFLMDTAVRISVYDASRSEEELRPLVEGAFGRMAALERKTTRYGDSSDVAAVCRAAGKDPVHVSDEVFEIFRYAGEVSRMTNGAFDLSVDAVQRIWGFSTDHPRVPDARTVQAGLDFVDYRNIRLNRPAVGLAEEGMSVDLGGIAKGYAVDRAVDSLRDAGIRAGIVDAGGDLRIFGEHPAKPSWRIGIRHPRSEEGRLFGTIETRAASIATSGDYERYFMEGAIRYHHILDPRTGTPANRCVSVTIVAELALTADAYATAVFVMGPEAGMRFIEANEGVEGIILWEEEDGLTYRVSTGLKRQLRVFEERGS